MTIKTSECLLTVESVKRIRGRAMTRALKLAKQVERDVFIYPSKRRSAVIDVTAPVPELIRELGEVWRVSPNGNIEKVG